MIPPVLDRLNKNKQVNIDSISVRRVENPRNDSVHWFDIELPLNPGMVAIIGNKGTGKSALSDIIGHLCTCNTMGSASFLNATRFRKLPQNYANDYAAKISWADGKTREISLSEEASTSTIEDAQYLPQKYIEDVCNNLDNEFQDEIDKVIFSYVERAERRDAHNLDELVQQKSHAIEQEVQEDIELLNALNDRIIKLERKKTNSYKKQILESLEKVSETLDRHEKSKPAEVKKTENKQADAEYLAKLAELNAKIEQEKQGIEETTSKIANINTQIDEAESIITQLGLLESQFLSVKGTVDTFIEKYHLDTDIADMALITPQERLLQVKERAMENKQKYQEQLSNPEHGLTATLHRNEELKANLVANADNEEKLYQKYLVDLEDWNVHKVEIKSDMSKEGSLE